MKKILFILLAFLSLQSWGQTDWDTAVNRDFQGTGTDWDAIRKDLADSLQYFGIGGGAIPIETETATTRTLDENDITDASRILRIYANPTSGDGTYTFEPGTAGDRIEITLIHGSNTVAVAGSGVTMTATTSLTTQWQLGYAEWIDATTVLWKVE